MTPFKKRFCILDERARKARASIFVRKKSAFWTYGFLSQLQAVYFYYCHVSTSAVTSMISDDSRMQSDAGYFRCRYSTPDKVTLAEVVQINFSWLE